MHTSFLLEKASLWNLWDLDFVIKETIMVIILLERDTTLRDGTPDGKFPSGVFFLRIAKTLRQGR